MIIATYRNQPIKTIFSVLVVILGLFTLVKYQELEITTIESVINLIFNEGMTAEVYKTLAFNLASLLALLFIALLWVKSAIKPDWYCEDILGVNRWINVITAILLVAFSVVFIVYLFQKLTGFIILAFLLLIFIIGDTDSKKNRY